MLAIEIYLVTSWDWGRGLESRAPTVALSPLLYTSHTPRLLLFPFASCRMKLYFEPFL